MTMIDQFKTQAGLCLAGAVLLLSQPAQADLALTGDLSVAVEGLQNRQGVVCLKIFSGRQGFPSENDTVADQACVSIDAIPLTVTFNDLAFGNYAIALYHDSNGDGQLNRGAFGIPVEGFGFSNNPAIRMGPAEFEEAMFFWAGANSAITIQMQYSPWRL